MYWIFLFSLLYILKKHTINNTGVDERSILYPNNDNITSKKILQIYINYKTIEFLESKNILNDDKLHEIKGKNAPEVYNVFNGGLFDDWNVELF